MVQVFYKRMKYSKFKASMAHTCFKALGAIPEKWQKNEPEKYLQINTFIS